jgi:hypothetical protein
LLFTFVIMGSSFLYSGSTRRPWLGLSRHCDSNRRDEEELEDVEDVEEDRGRQQRRAVDLVGDAQPLEVVHHQTSEDHQPEDRIDDRAARDRDEDQGGGGRRSPRPAPSSARTASPCRYVPRGDDGLPACVVVLAHQPRLCRSSVSWSVPARRYGARLPGGCHERRPRCRVSPARSATRRCPLWHERFLHTLETGLRPPSGPAAGRRSPASNAPLTSAAWSRQAAQHLSSSAS